MRQNYKTGVVRRLDKKGLIKPPGFVAGSVQYETMMGSVAYGVSSDTSDVDIYGFCVPPKDIVFPHLAGYIPGFSRQIPKFDQFQQHHIKEDDTEYDIVIYNIVKYFALCMENNPNMIDSLFTATNMVLSRSKIADMVRDERKIFLHKGAWHKFKGYAYSQMSKMKIKNPEEGSKRWHIQEKYGYDVKFGYHLVRLLNEVEQILMTGDIDLMQNNDQLKSIRKGEWTLKEVEDYFVRKEKDLESLYISSKLPKYPDEDKIKRLLLECLEEFYGDLESCVISVDKSAETLRQIRDIIYKANI